MTNLFEENWPNDLSNCARHDETSFLREQRKMDIKHNFMTIRELIESLIPSSRWQKLCMTALEELELKLTEALRRLESGTDLNG